MSVVFLRRQTVIVFEIDGRYSLGSILNFVHSGRKVEREKGREEENGKA
jgi:hypothetical protein